MEAHIDSTIIEEEGSEVEGNESAQGRREEEMRDGLLKRRVAEEEAMWEALGDEFDPIFGRPSNSEGDERSSPSSGCAARRGILHGYSVLGQAWQPK